MNKKKRLIGMTLAVFFILFLFSLNVVFAAESITITTFYPSPYGSYNILYVADKLGIGTTNPIHKLEVIGGAMYSNRYPATSTINWNNGNVQSITISANTTFTFSNGQDGARYVLIMKWNSTTATLTWTAGTVRWPNNTEPTWTKIVGRTDYVAFIYNGVDSRYDNVGTQLNIY